MDTKKNVQYTLVLIITLKSTENDTYYNDRILKNIHNEDYEIFYSGQAQGRKDFQLIESVTNNDIFKIYYRYSKRDSFKFLGETSISNVIQNRAIVEGENAEQDNRLKLHFIIKNGINIDIPNCNFVSSGKFKKDVLIHSGYGKKNGNEVMKLNDDKVNINLRFYKYSNMDSIK